jgi:diguanylate cyclase (GGDEF)-like protein/PAS domain S-box-containing protein
MNDSKELYQNILDSIADGIYFMDTERKITYWNKGAERITGYSCEEVIGSHCKDDILVHIDEKGESLCKNDLCPAYDTILTGKTNEIEKLYFHHKCGSRIPISVRTSASCDEDGNINGAVEIFRENFSRAELEKEFVRLRELTLIDHLTEIGNRRFGEIQLESCFNQLKRYGWSFGVMILDLDGFKKINKSYGHDAGDRILKMVSQTIKTDLRPFDKVIRWGGDEFLVIFLNIDGGEFKKLSERLKVLISESFLFVDEQKVNISASIGATLCKSEDTQKILLKRADDLMYKSKKLGTGLITID